MVKKYRKPHRFKKRKPIYRHRFFWIAVLFLVFLSSLFYFLFFSNFFQIKTISVSGLEQVERGQIDLLIQEGIRSKILFFPLESIFLVDSSRIKKDILKNFPQIAKIEIRRAFPDSLNILIVERKELAVFCPPVQAGQEENCFVLDKEGIIFETERETESLIKIRDKRELDPSVLGERVVEKEELARLLEINFQLKQNLGILIKEFIIYLERLTALTQDGWEIYFNLQEDVEWQLTKLKVLLEERIPKEERENLEYIELRFGNFANPKYKD